MQKLLYEKYGIERDQANRNLEEFYNIKIKNRLLRNAGGQII